MIENPISIIFNLYVLPKSEQIVKDYIDADPGKYIETKKWFQSSNNPGMKRCTSLLRFVFTGFPQPVNRRLESSSSCSSFSSYQVAEAVEQKQIRMNLESLNLAYFLELLRNI